MSFPQVLEGEDVATALRDCTAQMLTEMGAAAATAVILRAQLLEIDLGFYDTTKPDLKLRIAPAALVELILVECQRREPALTEGVLAEWREIRERYHV